MDEFDFSGLKPHIYGPLRSANLDDLHLVLEESAGRHARSALREFTDEDYGQVAAALHAGIAIEHLAKRCLIEINPVLIAENDLNSILMLSGNGKLSKTRAFQIKTISATEACKRVKQLYPSFPYRSGTEFDLFAIRNAAAHLGITDTGPMRQAVQLMVRMLNSLIGILCLDPAEFWGDSLPVALELINEAAGEVRTMVAAKYSAASIRLEERMVDLDPAQREAVLRAVSGEHKWQIEGSLGWPCPVCHQPAWLECQSEPNGEPQPALDSAGEPITVAETVLYPDIFYCSACGLQLDGDELREADMPDSVDIGPQQVDLELMEIPYEPRDETTDKADTAYTVTGDDE
jgi:hypothetical protein